MSRTHLLVVDADLPKRLATELALRGRAARSAADLGLAGGVTDPEVLRGIAVEVEREVPGRRWVLVTGDDAMPAEHGDVIRETAATIATVHPDVPEGVLEDEWRRDVVHRWAHAMQEQQPGSVRRWSLGRSEVWCPRARHVRLARERGWGAPWSPA